MNGIAGLHHPLMQALGLAILHSLWQGILLYCIFKLVLAFVPERKSAWRYRISYVMLSALFLLFLFTFGTEGQQALIVMRSVPTVTHGHMHLTAPGTPTGSLWQLLFSPLQLAIISCITPWLSVLYATGVIVLCARMIRELLQLRYLRQRVMLPEDLLQQKFLQLKDQAGIRRNVLLRLSERVQVPLMLGHLKPIILLPLSLASRLDQQQLEAILLHELAHIRRNDYFWNILQMVMETLLFFNPVAWMLSAVIREEREHCCDAYVLRRSSASLPYAHALLALEEYRLNGYVMAATGNKKSLLLNRIKRITAMKPNPKNSQRTLATLTILVLFAAMICFVSAFGQSRKEKTTTPSKTAAHSNSKSYSKNTVTVIDDKGNVKTYSKENGDTAGMAEALKAVPDAMEIAEKAMKQVDMKDIHKQVENAMAIAGKTMSNIDWQQYSKGLEEGLKSMDWEEFQPRLEAALNKVDWDKIESDVAKSIKEINWDEVGKSVEAAQANISRADRVQMKKDMEQARAEMDQAREEVRQAMQEARTQLNDTDMEEVRKALDEAKVQIRKAKKEMKKAIEENRDTEDSQVD